MKITIKEQQVLFPKMFVKIKFIDLSETTVKEWYHIFREVCAFVIINYTEAIGGPGHIVEICEYSIDSKESSPELWMFTGIDRKTGQNFAIHAHDMNYELLWPIIKNYILPGTKIVTELHIEYSSLEEKCGETPSLIFIPLKDAIRTPEDFHLDQMWYALNNYIQLVTSPHHGHKELYMYQFLYFNRDGTAGKPASALLFPFLKDVKRAYPGFEQGPLGVVY